MLYWIFLVGGCCVWDWVQKTMCVLMCVHGNEGAYHPVSENSVAHWVLGQQWRYMVQRNTIDTHTWFESRSIHCWFELAHEIWKSLTSFYKYAYYIKNVHCLINSTNKCMTQLSSRMHTENESLVQADHWSLTSILADWYQLFYSFFTVTFTDKSMTGHVPSFSLQVYRAVIVACYLHIMCYVFDIVDSTQI